MKQIRYILLFGLLSALLSSMSVPIYANEAKMDNLHCGDIVTISATPDPGYKFVRWSDGNTDNPRDIEITDAVNLSAEYAPICYTDTVPTVWLYNQLMMVNVDSLQHMGYTFSEQSVSWYRIVGDNDASSAESNDQLLATGYFYNLQPDERGIFYAAVDVSATPETGELPRCSDILYSRPIRYGTSGIDAPIESQTLALIPNYGPPGTLMEINGLAPSLYYTIQIYDAVGRLLEEYTSLGKEQYTISAQQIPGYYLVRVTSKDGKSVLKYVVKQ